MANPVQTAQAVADAQAALATATAAHTAAVEATAAPRAPMIVLMELLGHFVSRFGNHPELEKLLLEFTAGVTPPAS